MSRSHVNATKTPVTAKQIGEKTEAVLTGAESTPITDVSHDSRRVGPGALFVAVSGALFDAHKFVPQVMDAGAAGVISERVAPDNFRGLWLQVANVRKAMPIAAGGVHHPPSRELNLVGTPGTHAKKRR